MPMAEKSNGLFERFIVSGDPGRSDYLELIKEIVARKQQEGIGWQKSLDDAYRLLQQEILENSGKPTQEISFGTSGWRGKLGKDIFVRSVGLAEKQLQ